MKRLCLIHANCQGEPLVDLLGAHPDFSRDFETRHYVNYTRQPVPAEDLARCGLFLYQRLEAHWGGLASDVLLAALPPGTPGRCLPPLCFQGYSPVWRSGRIIDYEDRFLEDLLARGLSDREIMHLYLHTDPARYYDLAAIFRDSEAREREKERHWDIRLTDFVRSRFRDEMLFHTVNHPGRTLCLMVAEAVLKRLGYPPLSTGVREAFPEPFAEFDLPVHPAVAAFQGLTFLSGHPRFPIYGRDMDLAEYVGCYLACRRLGETDFISFLRLRAAVSGKTPR
jgi:hypothetical protein